MKNILPVIPYHLQAWLRIERKRENLASAAHVDINIIEGIALGMVKQNLQ
jgi:hypothetical protein